MVNTTIIGTPGYLALPTGGAMSGAGVCLKAVVRERAVVPVAAFGAVWQRDARIDFTAFPSATSGRVT
jgi:hypothetical protein